jgi:DNA polymerase-1
MAGLLLFDGPAIAYRAHFALARSNLTTTSGQSTAATYGFVTTLLKLLRQYGSSHCCVAFDTEKPTYRHQLFEEYKAGRPGMPEELAGQIGWMKEIAADLGLRVCELDGYEADDIIGTLAVMASRAGLDTVIVTGDKDMLQLVDDRTRVVMLSGSGRDTQVLDAAAVLARYGVPPARLTDFFGLMGDAIDNVAGVPGIGEKTALQLVSRYGTIEAIYENLDGIPGSKAQKALRENRDKAFSSRELVTIHTQVPLNLTLDDVARAPVREAEIRTIFTRLSFRSLAAQVLGAASEAKPLGGVRPRVWEEPLGRHTIACEGALGVDVNLGEGPAAVAPLLGVALACEGGEDHYFPLGHREPGNVGGQAFREVGGPLLADPAKPKITHDAKRAILGLRRAGIETRGIEFDTMLARYLLNPGQGGLDIEGIALDYLGNLEGYVSDRHRAGTLATVREACEVCGRRARTAVAVRPMMEQDLRDRGLWDLFHDVELPLASVLAAMEQRGVRIDVSHLEALGDDLDCRVSLLEKEAYVLARRPFNLNSPREVSRILFEDLGLKPRRKTKTGYSTDLSVLVELSADHELPRKILEYRQLAKLKSTYVDQLLRFRDPVTNRIHASFNQTVAATGRLSSSDPNLQNIPVRGELGAEIRKAFIPGADHWIMVSADYSQVELRVVAHLSRDPELIAAFQRGEDIHTNTAARVFKVPSADVTPAMRGVAKVVNFGIIYGMGAQSLAKTTGFPLEEAIRFLEEHKRAYPGLYTYIDGCLEQARERGWVETVLGRKRYLPNVRSKEPALKSAAERAAINTPVQGSAADIIKIAMLGVHRQIGAQGLAGGIVIQVHDDILLECPAAEQAQMEAILYNQMTKAYSLAVPLKVDLRSGRNWYEAH